jgi:hypothetical protein
MKGNNTIVLCEAAMIEVMQAWVEKAFGPAAHLDSITYDYHGFKLRITDGKSKTVTPTPLEEAA